MGINVGELVVEIRGEMEQFEQTLERAIALTCAASEIINAQWDGVSVSLQSSSAAMAGAMDRTSPSITNLITTMAQMPQAILSSATASASLINPHLKLHRALNLSNQATKENTIGTIVNSKAEVISTISSQKGIISTLFKTKASKMSTAATSLATRETLKSTAAEFGNGAAIFQAGMMSKVSGTSMKSLGIAKGFTTVMTYGLGAAMRFLTGPFGIILSLAAMLLPSLLDLGKGMGDASSEVGELGSETAGLTSELEGLSEGLDIDDVDMDMSIELDVEIKKDKAVEAINGLLTESTSNFIEIANNSELTEEQITKKIEDEVKKRKEIQKQALADQEAAEIEAFTQSAALLGYSAEELSQGIADISSKYQGLEEQSNEYTDAMAQMALEIAETGSVTQETWDRVAAASNSNLDQINADLEMNTDAQNTWTMGLIDNGAAAIKALDSSKFEEYSNKALEYEQKMVASVNAVKDATIAALDEELEAGRLSQTEYATRVNDAKKLAQQEIDMAGLRKRAVINQLLEEVVARNGVNDSVYQSVIDSNTNIANEEQRHADKKLSIEDDFLIDVQALEGSAREKGEKARALYIQKNKDLEAEELAHKDTMSGYYLEQDEALSLLSTGHQEAFSNMLSIAQTEGVNISTETQAMADAVGESVGTLPNTAYNSMDESTIFDENGNPIATKVADSFDEDLGIVDGESEVMAEKAKVIPNTIMSTFSDEEMLEEFGLATTSMIEKGIINPIDIALGIDDDGVSLITKNQGKGVVQGLIKGIDSMVDNLQASMNAVASVLAITVKVQTNQESPSKLLEQQGSYAIQGLEIGVEKRIKPLKEKMMNVSSLFTNSFGKNAMPNTGGVSNYNNQRSNSFAPTINVNGGIDSLEYKREINRLMRQQAVAIAR